MQKRMHRFAMKVFNQRWHGAIILQINEISLWGLSPCDVLHDSREIRIVGLEWSGTLS